MPMDAQLHSQEVFRDYLLLRSQALTKHLPHHVAAMAVLPSMFPGVLLLIYTVLITFNLYAANVFDNLAPGNYTLYVKDANNCSATTSTVLAGTPSTFVITLGKKSPGACVNDGKITISKSGGVSPYQYSLDGINYGSSNVYDNLAPGTYTAYAIDSRGCTATAEITLTAPSLITITSLTITPPLPAVMMVLLL